MDQQGYEPVHQGRHVVEAFRDCRGVQVVLAEVLMEVAGDSEQAADVGVAGFRAEPVGRDEVVAMAAVLPAALFGDGLQDFDSGVPPFLGCLRQIAGGEFRSGLLQNSARSAVVVDWWSPGDSPAAFAS